MRALRPAGDARLDTLQAVLADFYGAVESLLLQSRRLEGRMQRSVGMSLGSDGENPSRATNYMRRKI